MVRRPAGAHALADGLHAGAGREAVGGALGRVPGGRRDASRSWWTRATRSRPAARRPTRSWTRWATTCRPRGRGWWPRPARGAWGWRPPPSRTPCGRRLAEAAPEVELVPADGWVEAMRAVKTPDEVERIAAACAVADRALAALLPEIRPGVTEHDLALRLEWLMRTGGAECLAFDVACLAGPEAALPHGSPGDRPVLADAALLFDFGAQVEGYRSDMTRTLFVGEPTRARPGRVRDRRARPSRRRSMPWPRRSAGRPRPFRTAGPSTRSPARSSTGRSLARLRPRPRARDRPRDARGAAPVALRAGDAAAQPHRVQRGARDLPRGADGRPDRGPRPPRARTAGLRPAHALPARCHRLPA